MKALVILLLLISLTICGAAEVTAFTLPDPTVNAVLYGDAYSYSLPILAYNYDQFFGGGVGPGNPFYVNSSPGQIMNLVVPATGASGTQVTTNYAGQDKAYETPSGSGGLPYFTTNSTAVGGYPHPDQSVAGTLTAAQDNPNTWNMTVASLMSFLGTGQVPVIFFNNNQTNSGTALDQQLAVWGQIALVDSDTGAPTQYFTLTNVLVDGNQGLSGGNLITTGMGGIVSGPGKNPALYNFPAAGNDYPVGSPTPGIPSVNPNDFVLSGGQVCILNGVIHACDGTPGLITFNHNLGANQAAYAVTVPELNSILSAWTASSPYDVLQFDIRMGCNPAFYPGGVCPEGLPLNNGYEQIFIGAAQVVPEPSTLLLVGGGLLGLGFSFRRRFRK